MSRELSDEPLLPSDEIQGDILLGLPKRVELFVFFRITNVAKFKTLVKQLDITTTTRVRLWRKQIAARKAKGIDTLMPTPGLNVAFTAAGLAKLGVPALPSNAETKPFKDGMASRKAILADPPAASWAILKPGVDVHGVFIVTGASEGELANMYSQELVPADGWTTVHEELGVVRPEPTKGHEHFGFADGVSQPGVRGQIEPGEALTPSENPLDENQGMPGQDLLWPGEFVFGYPSQNPNGVDFTVKGLPSKPPIPVMKDGAFMVFRRLAQTVPEFNLAVKLQSQSIGAAFDPASPELLGAQMVGRWKSGAPIINHPTADDPADGDGQPMVNDFEFDGDVDGKVCPFAAHVRKAYPRNDVPAGFAGTVDQAEAKTQTHRMMRRGIAFGPELTQAEAESGVSNPALQRGLLFACYVTSIKDQFEFVQQSWVDNPGFSQPGSGFDPIISQAPLPKAFLGACPVSGNVAKKPKLEFNQFVFMQGGEYFFAPSMTMLKTL